MESPLKYFFRNLVALPEARSHFLDFGNLVHETLELYFDAAMRGLEIPDMKTLKTSFKQVLERKPYYAEFEDRGWNILEAYVKNYRKEFAIPSDNEKRVSGVSFAKFGDNELLLSGVVDKITRNEDGTFTVWDYKTGRAYSDMDAQRKGKLKRQATFYKLLLRDAFGGQYDFAQAIFDFIEPNKKGEYEQAVFEISDADVELLQSEINQLTDDILNGTLLDKDFSQDPTNDDLLAFLEVMRNPGEVVQGSLFE
jgi:DNA helicase-2/ATP-dependent DNA helicase PcrA